jgi:hypothetical protein
LHPRAPKARYESTIDTIYFTGEHVAARNST